MRLKLLLFMFILFALYSVPVSAEGFQGIDPGTLSGYYLADDRKFLILEDGTLFDLSDVSLNPSAESSAISALSNDVETILTANDGCVCLVPLKEKGRTESGGIYYALYDDYKGTIYETEFKEGSEVMFGDYIFDNDYAVVEREPLSVFFSIEAPVGNVSSTMEGEGYESPEEAVSAYIYAFRQGDLYKMISTFAVESFVENYDLGKDVERMTLYTSRYKYVPSISTYAQMVNLEARRSDIMDDIRRQYFILTNSEAADGMEITLGGMTGSDFLNEIFAADDDYIFSELNFYNRFYDPGELAQSYNSEINQKNIQKFKEVYGCDDLQSVAAELSVGYTRYLLCMDVANYDGAWYNVSCIGNIGSILGLPAYTGGISMISELLEKYPDLAFMEEE